MFRSRTASHVAAAALIALALWLPSPEVSSHQSGFMATLRSAHDLITVIAVAFGSLMVGYAVLGPKRTGRLNGAIGVTAALIAGTLLLGGFLLLMGLAGLFEPWQVAAVVVFAGAACTTLGNLTALRSDMSSTRADLGAISPRGLRYGALVISGLVAGFTLLLALGPTVSWDGPMYHVDLPREFLAAGEIHLPIDNLHLSFVGTPQMLNSVFLAVGAEAGPATMQWVWTVALWSCVVAALRRWVSPLAAGVGAVLFWAFPLIPLIGSQDLVDLSMTTAVFVLSLVVVDWLTSGDRVDAVVLGLLAGASMAAKYQGIAYTAGIAIVLMVGAFAGRVRVDIPVVVGAAGIALAAVAPVLIKNMIHFGAPLYPVYADRIYPDWLLAVAPDATPKPSPYGILSSARRDFSPLAWITAPESLTPEAEGVWYGFPPLFTLGLLAFVTRYRRVALYLAAPVVLGMLFILAISPSINLRYLAPVAPVAVILVSIVVAAIAESSPEWVSTVAISATLLLAGLGIADWVSDRAERGQGDVSLGFESQEEFFRRPPNGSQRQLNNLGDELATLGISQDRRALLLWEGRGDLLGTGLLQDNVFTNWRMYQDASAGKCFEGDSISHVVVAESTVEYLVGRGVTEQELGLEDFERFADRCLFLARQVDGFRIYSVRK